MLFQWFLGFVSLKSGGFLISCRFFHKPVRWEGLRQSVSLFSLHIRQYRTIFVRYCLRTLQAAFFVWSQNFSVLHSFLFWCDSTPFFIGSDKVAAIKKSGFLSNIIQIIIRVQQEILRLIQANILDILLAGAAVIFPKKSCKIRVAHMAHLCQLLYLQRFGGMRINIFQNVIKEFCGKTIMRRMSWKNEWRRYCRGCDCGKGVSIFSRYSVIDGEKSDTIL